MAKAPIQDAINPDAAPPPDVAPAPAPAAKAVVAPMADAAKMFEPPAAPVADMQERIRAVIEKGLTETRANYSKVKRAADEASNAMEASYASVKTGVVEINVKALEALRASADANFDFIKSVIHVKSPSDLVTLHTEFARKQIEMLTSQTKELATLAQKVATESVEPFKAQIAKSFKIAV